MNYLDKEPDGESNNETDYVELKAISHLEILYTTATIIVLIMIIVPPVFHYGSHGDAWFRGYKNVLNLSPSEFIDLGRLSLQFLALGAVVITIKRLIHYLE